MRSTAVAPPRPPVPLTMQVLSVADIEQEHGDISALSKKSRKSLKTAEREYSKKFDSRLQQSRSKKGEQIITRAEVSLHNRPNDAYVIINGTVYDATNFVEFHPGGSKILLEHAGRDATVSFEDMGHSLAARFQLADLYVGDLPCIERVISADSDEDSSDSDNEKENAARAKQQNSQNADKGIKTGHEQAPAVEHRPDPLIRRIVPNRYRRRAPDEASDERPVAFENSGPPRLHAANSWRSLFHWRIFFRVAPLLLFQLIMCVGPACKSLGTAVARRVRYFFKIRMGLVVIVTLVLAACFLALRFEIGWLHELRHVGDWASNSGPWPQPSISSAPAQGSRLAAAPPGHDSHAVLYF